MIFFFVSLTAFSHDIAVVDPRMVLEQYKKRVYFENDLKEKQKSYHKFIFDEKIKILEEEHRIFDGEKNISEKEMMEISSKKEKIDEKYTEIEESLKKLHLEYFNILKSDIAIAAVVVGKEMGYDMVINKEMFFYGGDDITKNVIDFLNSGEKILIEDSMKNDSRSLELIR